MTDATFEAYIDESGCEGFRFGPNASSTWFVLAAVVVRKRNSRTLVELLDLVRTATGIAERKGVHFRKLSHEHKLAYLARVAHAPARLIVVAVHKPKLDRAIFEGGCRLYFYTTKLLIERISWLVRESRNSNDDGDGTAELIFSKRKTMPYGDLKAYLSKLNSDRSHNSSIHWSSLTADRFHVVEHNKKAGLQVADACAHSAWRRLEAPRVTDYARILSPIMYRRASKLNGYGVKILPAAAAHLI